MVDQECSTCKFFRAKECRYNPPRVIVIPVKYFNGDSHPQGDFARTITTYPSTQSYGWCGKYECNT